MSRPTTRVLAVLEMLQTRGSERGPQLAAELGVDVRTIRRYVAQLEEMGIPITADRGRGGGYALVAGFKLPPMMFTDDEALALSVGLIAARGLALAGAAPAVASAQAKLERVMPATLRKRVRAIDETVALEFSRPRPPGDNAALAMLSAAAQERRRVTLGYRSAAGEPSERAFDPYGLAYRGGCWYVVGHCHLREGLRSFRLDRVATVAPLEARFRRPADFDALAHLTFSFASLPRAHATDVLLRTDLATAKRTFFAAIGLFEAVPDGVRLTSQVDDLDWFARELSRAPFAFEIRRPAALREALAAHARALLQSAGRGAAPKRR